MKKKILLCLLCGILLVGVTGCGNSEEKLDNNTKEKNDNVKILECNKDKSDNWTSLSSEYTITFTDGEFTKAVLTNKMTILSEWYRKTIDEYLDSIERIYSGYDIEVEEMDEESTTYNITLDKNGLEEDLDTRIVGDKISSYNTALENDAYTCN